MSDFNIGKICHNVGKFVAGVEKNVGLLYNGEHVALLRGQKEESTKDKAGI